MHPTPLSVLHSLSASTPLLHSDAYINYFVLKLLRCMIFPSMEGHAATFDKRGPTCARGVATCTAGGLLRRCIRFLAQHRAVLTAVSQVTHSSQPLLNFASSARAVRT